MTENLYKTTEHDVHSSFCLRRMKSETRTEEICKMQYRVVSVLPFTDENYVPDTADEKMMYLVNGKEEKN